MRRERETSEIIAYVEITIRKDLFLRNKSEFPGCAIHRMVIDSEWVRTSRTQPTNIRNHLLIVCLLTTLQ